MIQDQVSGLDLLYNALHSDIELAPSGNLAVGRWEKGTRLDVYWTYQESWRRMKIFHMWTMGFWFSFLIIGHGEAWLNNGNLWASGHWIFSPTIWTFLCMLFVLLVKTDDHTIVSRQWSFSLLHFEFKSSSQENQMYRGFNLEGLSGNCSDYSWYLVDNLRRKSNSKLAMRELHWSQAISGPFSPFSLCCLCASDIVCSIEVRSLMYLLLYCL